MGDINQLEWVRQHLARARPPFLEIGSKQYGTVSQDYRCLLAGRGSYIGCDMAAGAGVDVVADLTADFERLPAPLRMTRFKTILCMSVMEHVRDVYRFTANLRRLLADDGIAFISVPWVWRFHGYPSDYWRFSPEALKFLFEPLALDAQKLMRVVPAAGPIRPARDRTSERLSELRIRHRAELGHWPLALAPRPTLSQTAASALSDHDQRDVCQGSVIAI